MQEGSNSPFEFKVTTGRKRLTLIEPVSIKQLLEAGAHFGHQTSRWHPRMRSYIFTQRNGIHIIDLEQTLRMLQKACEFVRDLVAGGEEIIFVGTKKQAQEVVEQEAERCGMCYVNQRWLGGMLTNFDTIQSRIDHLVRLEDSESKGEFDLLLKKEALKLDEEISRLNRHIRTDSELITVNVFYTFRSVLIEQEQLP